MDLKLVKLEGHDIAIDVSEVRYSGAETRRRTGVRQEITGTIAGCYGPRVVFTEWYDGRWEVVDFGQPEAPIRGGDVCREVTFIHGETV